MRVREGDGGRGRQLESAGTEGWAVEERLEREQPALGEDVGVSLSKPVW